MSIKVSYLKEVYMIEDSNYRFQNQKILEKYKMSENETNDEGSVHSLF